MITQKGHGSPAGNALNKIEKMHMKKQFHDNGFVCSGTGGGGDGTRFKHLKISFGTKIPLTIQLARKYIVDGVISYVNEINQNKHLEQHFTDWPFTYKKLNYTIDVSVNGGAWPLFPDGPTPDNKISYTEFSNGTIYYLIDVNTKKLPQVIHKETLIEAIAILKAEGWTEPQASIDN
ncbi:MAG: hypothetical protein AAGG81_01875 [Chlamydiota bacterium]